MKTFDTVINQGLKDGPDINTKTPDRLYKTIIQKELSKRRK